MLQRARVRFEAFFDEPGDVRALALLRIMVGPMVIYHLLPFLRDMLRGAYYADFFHDPWFDWLSPPPRLVYFGLLTLCVPSALMTSLGLKTRWASAYTAAFVTYNFFLSETFFRHNRNFIVLVLIMLALVPCGRTLSLDARRGAVPRDTRASLWPMYLMRFEVVAVYYASSISKLLNPDWRSGIVMLGRSRWYEPRLRDSGLPDFAVELVTNAGFHAWFAGFAILSELLIATLLLMRRHRKVGIYIAISFHALIELTLSVQIFSYLAIGGLLIWVTPKVRDRTLEFAAGSASAALWQRWFARLDWLQRFRMQTVESPDFDGIRLTDRDGTRWQGRRAKLRALLLCPVAFWFVAPLVLWDSWLSQRGGRGTPPALSAGVRALRSDACT